MPTIVSRITGGIGNQLFCYAAARRLALVTDSELVIDDVSGFVRDPDYRRQYQLDHFNIPCRKATARERLEPFSRLRRYLKRAWNGYLPYNNRSYILQNGMDFDPRLLSFQPHGTLYLEGYWQSENYFKDVEATIRRDLGMHAPTDAENVVAAERIHGTVSVGVHVRFFDRPNDGPLDDAPSSYYCDAVRIMENLVSGAHYFVFSDRPDAARPRIPLPDERITLISHNRGDAAACADLWLMTQCRHFIIANSTFSWWGAWLAASGSKHVVAPGFERRHGRMLWGFDGLLPASWIRS